MGGGVEGAVWPAVGALPGAAQSACRSGDRSRPGVVVVARNRRVRSNPSESSTMQAGLVCLQRTTWGIVGHAIPGQEAIGLGELLQPLRPIAPIVVHRLHVFSSARCPVGGIDQPTTRRVAHCLPGCI